MEPSEGIDWKQVLTEFLSASPRPWGWARWLVACARAELALKLGEGDYRDILMQLLAIAPEPKSYLKWNRLKEQLAEQLGESYPAGYQGFSLLAHQVTDYGNIRKGIPVGYHVVPSVRMVMEDHH